MYAVVVTFQIKDGAMDAFLPTMIASARTSLTEEPACHRFDVCTDRAHPDEVFLYELYTDRAAYEAHLESAHFKNFDTFLADLVERKGVRTYAEVAS